MPPHERLYRHVLEYIFAFLSFSDLARVLCVNHAWLAAVCSMPGLNEGKPLIYSQPNEFALLMQGGGVDILLGRLYKHFDNVLSSRMARHVSVLATYAFPISMVHLQRLAICSPFLHTLSLTKADTIEWSNALRLPVSLKHVSLSFDWATADKINAVIRYLAIAHPALVSLGLGTLSNAVLPQICLQPLDQLVQFKRLGLQGSYSNTFNPLRLTSAQVFEVRALVHLEYFNCNVDEATMLQLLEPLEGGRYLKWTDLPPGSALTDAVGARFNAVPHIQSFDTSKFYQSLFLTSFNTLARLPSLTSIVTGNVPCDALFASLSEPLLQLTHLDLMHIDLTSTQMMVLMRQLPKLHTLSIRPVDCLPTLGFLQPVRASLRKLHLGYHQNGTCLPPAVRELGELALTHLFIHERPPEATTTIPERLASLCVPSALLPTLQVFRFTADPHN
jgi:hypothetical protein